MFASVFSFLRYLKQQQLIFNHFAEIQISPSYRNYIKLNNHLTVTQSTCISIARKPPAFKLKKTSNVIEIDAATLNNISTRCLALETQLVNELHKQQTCFSFSILYYHSSLLSLFLFYSCDVSRKHLNHTTGAEFPLMTVFTPKSLAHLLFSTQLTCTRTAVYICIHHMDTNTTYNKAISKIFTMKIKLVLK